MKKVFISSKLRGNTEENLLNAYKFCALAIGCGYIPIAPHTIFPNYLDDSNESERLTGIQLGIELMKDCCDEVWVCGEDVSEGMELEVRKALEFGIPIVFRDLKGKVINHDTAGIDSRLSDKLKGIIRDVDEYCCPGRCYARPLF